MAMVDAVAALAQELNFKWFSEHLSMFLVANGSVPNAQAGLGLPVPYDEESFEIVRNKLIILKNSLGCSLLLENAAIFTPIPDGAMTEPEFLNRLHAEVGCHVEASKLVAAGKVDLFDTVRIKLFEIVERG
jgi:uncharacterized protein (UPF0276 family)